MGLLTDPGTERSQLPALLERHHRPLCVALYLTGLLWFLALAHNSFNHGTYFSENALLPGLVEGEFHGDTHALRYLESLTEEAERHPSGTPYAWLVGQFTQLGLDTYTHNFTLHYPMGKMKTFSGQNVYGILRAGRGSSTEAIVVCAPYRPPSSLVQTTAPAIALMLSMARFFSKQVYWAKDLIFLVTEHEQLGAEAWLGAYHRSSAGGAAGPLHHGGLQGRAGAIQAAINLEIHSSRASHLDVKVEGLNGQLPNLDLVNLIHRLCQRENVPHTFKNRGDHPRPETFDGWLHQLQTLLSMVTAQASGVPTGNHGLFHRYGIASVTVEGGEWGGSRRVGLHQLGRVLEGVCRSLNNLLERFHQSFFFYLLPATNRYISIGVYMPPFALLAGGLLVKALALWYSTSCAAELQACQNDDKNTKKINYGVLGSLPLVVAVHLCSGVVAAAPVYVSRLAPQLLGLSPEETVFLGLLSAALAFLFIPYFITRCGELGDGSWEVVKTVAVLELGVLVFAGAVYNFSLALIITLAFTPVAVMASPTPSRIRRALQSALLLLVHPLSLLVLFVLMDTRANFPSAPTLKLLARTYTASKRAVMYSVADGLIYSNWVFDAAMYCLHPVWLLLWHIVHYPNRTI